MISFRATEAKFAYSKRVSEHVLSTNKALYYYYVGLHKEEFAIKVHVNNNREHLFWNELLPHALQLRETIHVVMLQENDDGVYVNVDGRENVFFYRRCSVGQVKLAE